MTQPPGWPPQGGYGPPPPPQPPPQYPGPYTAPVPNYGAPYGTYPPPPPAPPGRNRAAIVVASVVAAVVLIGGGVYLATNNGDSAGNDTKPLADKSTSAPPSESASTEDTADPSSDETGDGTVTPPATGVVGQWQDDTDKTLTVGTEYTSGDYVGDCPLSYIDPGGKGILTGMGTDRSDGSFRMVLKPMSTESSSGDGYISATVTRSGDSVDITWDDGGTDTLAYVGE